MSEQIHFCLLIKLLFRNSCFTNGSDIHRLNHHSYKLFTEITVSEISCTVYCEIIDGVFRIRAFLNCIRLGCDVTASEARTFQRISMFVDRHIFSQWSAIDYRSKQLHRRRSRRAGRENSRRYSIKRLQVMLRTSWTRTIKMIHMKSVY